MRKLLRIHKTWLIALAITGIALGTLISVLVFATGDSRLTATAYSDVIRFQAEGVATLQVRIFDLSGKEVWDSGMISGDIVDWDRRNDTGERLAYGAYIYSAQGWNAQGDLIFQKNGKLALMPGDTVQLQAAALPTPVSAFNPLEDRSLTVQPKGLGDTGIYGTVGIGTSSPSQILHVKDGNMLLENTTGTVRQYFYSSMRRWMFFSSGIDGAFGIYDLDAGQRRLSILDTGNVGIGMSSTNASAIPAKLTIEASSGDLIAAYNSSSRVAGAAVFVVKNTGEVRADGAYYSGTGGFHTGNADVAERINTSEWVEPGNVVEIDPDHPGFFRISSSPYSTKVAGIISTSPGVILGNSFDEATDDWEDNRPVLAVTGRVPCKVSAENGPIQIGDLLVASSTPGIAMKGEPERGIGAVVGKAMEPLEDGEGTIVVQVMLR